jgi:hypothetical protein
MSDLSVAKQKLKAGADWRGTITVDIGGESVELTVRQLRDPEFEEVMGMISRDELTELREQYPADKMEELRELRHADALDPDEQDRKDELESEMEDVDVNIFDILSQETFSGIRLAAIYGVEPDDEDKQEAFKNRAHEIEREYGIKVETVDDVTAALQDEWEQHIRDATNFTSFQIGMKVLTETVETEGN